MKASIPLSKRNDPKVILWLSFIPIICAFLLTYTSVATTSLDSLPYLMRAIDFVEHGILDPFRAGFTIILGLFVHFFDDPIFAGTVFIRVVFFLTVCLVYYLAYQLEGPVFGFIASLLYLTNGFFHYLGSRILLDNYYPFLSLIVIFISISIYQRPSYVKAIFASLIFFYALTVKVSIVFIFPLAFSLIIFSPSRWPDKNLWLTCAIPPALGVLSYILLNAVPAGMAGSGGFAGDTIAQINSVGITNIMIFVHAFIERYLDPVINTQIALVASIYVLFRAYSNFTARVLLVALLLSFPIVIILGTIGLRHAQAAGFVYILILIVSYAVYDFPKIVLSNFHRYVSIVVTVLLALLISWNQLFSSKYPSVKLIHNSNIVKIIKGEDRSWRTKGSYNDTLDILLRKTLLTPNREINLLVHGQNQGAVRYFLKKSELTNINIISTRSLGTNVRLNLSNIEKSLNSLSRLNLDDKQFITSKRKVLRLYSAQSSLKGGRINPIKISVLGINDLLSATESNKENLLLITGKNSFMRGYFNILGLEPITQHNSYSIYNINELRKHKSVPITCMNRIVWKIYKMIIADYPEAQTFYDSISKGRLNRAYIKNNGTIGRCIK